MSGRGPQWWTFLLFLPLLLLLEGCTAARSRGAGTDRAPALTNLDGEWLAHVKLAIAANDPEYLPAYRHLVDEADSLLHTPLYSVTRKTTVPPSGSKHDYLSLAPYWWPDPAQPDGLPWIRRDGEVNPLTRGDEVDVTARRHALDNLYRLSLAAYLSGKVTYADRAREQLRVWFLDPATRMTPHLEYAQGIPGLNDGRCYGIIEWRAVKEVITAAELLDHQRQLTGAERKGLDAWLGDYADWLMTSALGREEADRLNNHGTWYDAQLVSVLRHLDRDAEAKEILETAKTVRIAAHLAADGSQPEEIARTKSLSYSTMNLDGLTILAYHGRRLGIDLWAYRDDENVGLPQAYAFLQRYALGQETWPHQQLGSMEHARETLREQFLKAGSQLGVAEFCTLDGPDVRSPGSLDRLLYPCTERPEGRAELTN